MNAPYRRRIDIVTSDDFLDGIQEMPASKLRALCDDCRAEEDRLSYSRRLLHGQLDLLRDELAKRENENSQTSEAIGRLVEALSAPDSISNGSSLRSASYQTFYTPSGPVGRRRGDSVLEEIPIGRISEWDEEEINNFVSKISEEVTWVTSMRNKILNHIDEIQSELINRYRTGTTTISDVIG